MNDATANLPLPEPERRWSPIRWLMVIAFVFGTHIALIFLSGEKREPVPRAVSNVPLLRLANNSDELLLLNDPTLFVLPHQRDFAAVGWLKNPEVKPPVFRWTESPRPLTLAADGLAAAFGQFMRTNFFESQPPDFKPAPELNAPTLPVEPMLAQNSTMQIEGELARRRLPFTASLTNWPYADVLAPCVVQVLVNEEGNVASTALLKSCNYKTADDRALEVARALRFTPSANVTFGKIIFNWHTVPPMNETNY